MFSGPGGEHACCVTCAALSFGAQLALSESATTLHCPVCSKQLPRAAWEPVWPSGLVLLTRRLLIATHWVCEGCGVEESLVPTALSVASTQLLPPLLLHAIKEFAAGASLPITLVRVIRAGSSRLADVVRCLRDAERRAALVLEWHTEVGIVCAPCCGAVRCFSCLALIRGVEEEEEDGGVVDPGPHVCYAHDAPGAPRACPGCRRMIGAGGGGRAHCALPWCAVRAGGCDHMTCPCGWAFTWTAVEGAGAALRAVRSSQYVDNSQLLLWAGLGVTLAVGVGIAWEILESVGLHALA